ncbi:hypothetical protein NKH18_50495 [Streptomyces sp. M10(2022)]
MRDGLATASAMDGPARRGPPGGRYEQRQHQDGFVRRGRAHRWQADRRGRRHRQGRSRGGGKNDGATDSNGNGRTSDRTGPGETPDRAGDRNGRDTGTDRDSDGRDGPVRRHEGRDRRGDDTTRGGAKGTAGKDGENTSPDAGGTALLDRPAPNPGQERVQKALRDGFYPRQTGTDTDGSSTKKPVTRDDTTTDTSTAEGIRTDNRDSHTQDPDANRPADTTRTPTVPPTPPGTPIVRATAPTQRSSRRA